MTVTMYTRGLDELGDFASGDYRALLLKGSGYTVNRDHDYVSNLTPASNEVAGSGYAREVLASKTRTIDDTNDRITYDAADPDFGTIATGESVTGMVVFKQVTNDSDSILIAYFPLTSTDTAAIAPFVVTLGTSGLFYASGS